MTIHTNSDLPHAGEQLNKPSIRQRRRNDHRRRRKIPHSQVHAAEQESRQREAGQPQRSRVRDVALGRLVETWLRCTAESRQAGGVRRVDVGERVAAVAVVAVEVLVGVGILAVRAFRGPFGHD